MILIDFNTDFITDYSAIATLIYDWLYVHFNCHNWYNCDFNPDVIPDFIVIFAMIQHDFVLYDYFMTIWDIIKLKSTDLIVNLAWILKWFISK
jgi:hypothetical protein